MKKMRHILIVILLNTFFISNSIGQCYWAKGLGNNSTSLEEGNSVATDSLGNIYVGGVFSGSADFDPGPGSSILTSAGQDNFICKFNPDGIFIWAKLFGGNAQDVLNSIHIDHSGNIVCCGYFQGTCDFDPGVGVSNLSSTGSSDIYILKLDSNGNFIWAKKMGGIGEDAGYSIISDSNDNLISTGYFSNTGDFDPSLSTFNLISGGQFDIFISKLDSNGNFIWAKKTGGGSNDRGVSITLDSVQNIYTTGSFAGTVDFDPGIGSVSLVAAGSQAIYINKLDSNGNFVWAKNIGGPVVAGSGANQGNSISLDQTSNIFITGYFSGTVDFDPSANVFNLTSNGSLDIFICKIDNIGNFSWAKKIGGLGD
jgi:hypothetical protein